tara:strand:+ start:12300 stop:12743 length:444 start_codon:yes stop_codon:yes gene_type:complete
MVDVSAKTDSARVARASGRVRAAPATLALICDNGLKKGDVLAVARIAAIQAAKKCWELIPLCHQIPLSGVTVEFELDHDNGTIHIQAQCKTTAPTGVEMEALTAVSVAGLTLYDMCKAVDRGMSIDTVRLETKSGGAGGDWHRGAQA